MTWEREQIGACTLYRGDAREVLPTLGRVEAVVTDPPYGVDRRSLHGRATEWPLWKSTCAEPEWYNMTSSVLFRSLALGFHMIVWGGQYYPLPPKRGWLVWDKINRKFTSGDVELAWTTLDQPPRAFNYSAGQLVFEGKYHPTKSRSH